LAASDARGGERAGTGDPKEIQPVADFIADQANLFRKPPCWMWRKSGEDGDSRPWLSADPAHGRVARFEIGYLYAVQRAPGDDRGTLVRLTFQNLFERPRSHRI
jgi:hypothetical protein